MRFQTFSLASVFVEKTKYEFISGDVLAIMRNVVETTDSGEIHFKPETNQQTTAHGRIFMHPFDGAICQKMYHSWTHDSGGADVDVMALWGTTSLPKIHSIQPPCKVCTLTEERVGGGRAFQ